MVPNRITPAGRVSIAPRADPLELHRQSIRDSGKLVDRIGGTVAVVADAEFGDANTRCRSGSRDQCCFGAFPLCGCTVAGSR